VVAQLQGAGDDRCSLIDPEKAVFGWKLIFCANRFILTARVAAPAALGPTRMIHSRI